MTLAITNCWRRSDILIDTQDQPRVVDFGLARRMDDSPLATLHSQLTLTGQMLGSPNYLPPEQAAGKPGDVSRRTDVYALGATLYHLLTSRPPFQSESLAQTLDLVLHQDPVPPRLLHPSVPRDLETICLKCLEKEPARRYGTAKELADELRRFQSGEPIRARPVGPMEKTWRWCRRYPLTATAASAAVLFLLLGFLGVLGMWRQSERQRRRAETGEYVLAISSAQQALKLNNPDRALELLRQHPPFRALPNRPLAAELQQAGWEWRYLWQECETATHAEAVFGRMPSRIRSLEVSPDGHWLLAGSELGGVTLWDLRTREEIRLVAEAPAKGGIKAFGAFSADSALVAFTDQTYELPGGRIGFWNISTRQWQTPLMDPWITGGSMAFSPDGKQLIYGGCSPDFRVKVVVRDIATGQEVARLDKLTGITTDVHGLEGCLCPDGRTIVCSENDPEPQLVLWDFLDAVPAKRFPVRGEAIVAMALSPDGKLLATAAAYSETAIKLWEIPSFRPVGELHGHQSWVAGVKFSPDGKTLVSGGTDRTIRLWDVTSRSELHTLRPLPQPVFRVCFSPDGWKLFAGTSDGTIYRWCLDAQDLPIQPRSIPAKLDALAVAPDGTLFAGIHESSEGGEPSSGRTHGGTVLLGKADGVGSLETIPELGTNNLSLLFSTDGQSLFVGNANGEVKLWSLEQRQWLPCVHLTNDPVRALAQDRAGRTLLVCQSREEARPGRNCRISIWSVGDWRLRTSLSFPAVWPVCALSPDGCWLAAGHLEGAVQVWHLVQARPSARALAFSGRITGVAFSPDGRLLAAGTREGMVKVWRLPTLREVKQFPAHSGTASALNALVFSPDSRHLATAGENEEAVKIWEVDTWQELVTLDHPGEILWQLAFSTDGSQLSARNSQGDALFWHVPSWAEVAAREVDPDSEAEPR